MSVDANDVESRVIQPIAAATAATMSSNHTIGAANTCRRIPVRALCDGFDVAAFACVGDMLECIAADMISGCINASENCAVDAKRSAGNFANALSTDAAT